MKHRFNSASEKVVNLQEFLDTYNKTHPDNSGRGNGLVQKLVTSSKSIINNVVKAHAQTSFLYLKGKQKEVRDSLSDGTTGTYTSAECKILNETWGTPIPNDQYFINEKALEKMFNMLSSQPVVTHRDQHVFANTLQQCQDYKEAVKKTNLVPFSPFSN